MSAFIQRLGSLRSPVSTYANLPITGNILGDLRILTDLGVLYTWTSESSSGDLTNWKKVTVSSYNDLTDRPESTILDIDNITTNIRNIMMNHILIFFKKTITYGITIQKMVDGLLDNFQSQDTIDETESENYKWIKAQGVNTYDYFYVPVFNSDFDEYVKLYLTSKHYVDSGFDECRNQIINILYSETPHFSDISIRPSPFGLGAQTSVSVSNIDMNSVANLDFTWDLWIYPYAADETKSIIQFGDDTDFIIERLLNGKIHASLKTLENTLEVTSDTALENQVWTHVAVERINGYLRIYVNGVLEDTSLISDNSDIAHGGNVLIAYDDSSIDRFLFDEIRYSHGIARYTTNFTPMTVPYNNPTEEAPCDNMIIQSSGFEANEVPTSARIVIFQDYTEQDPPNVLPNEDIKAYISRDGGVTFTEVELAREMDILAESYSSFIHSSVNFYVGTVDISEQPSGKMMVWKITTHNNVQSWIRSVSLQWA